MEYKDLEKKSEKELEKMLGEERGTLYDLRLKVSVNQLKDIRALRKTKKNIARILTKLSEKKAEVSQTTAQDK